MSYMWCLFLHRLPAPLMSTWYFILYDGSNYLPDLDLVVVGTSCSRYCGMKRWWACWLCDWIQELLETPLLDLAFCIQWAAIFITNNYWWEIRLVSRSHCLDTHKILVGILGLELIVYPHSSPWLTFWCLYHSQNVLHIILIHSGTYPTFKQSLYLFHIIIPSIGHL